MAKVEGPLMSLGARGKIANTVVFFPWKGIHAVRRWTIPANPMSSGQGDIRLAMGAIGRACRVVGSAADYAAEVKGYMASGQTWVSTIVKKIISEKLPDGTEFDSVHGDYSGHTAKLDFDNEAANLGLNTFTVTYKGATNEAEAGFQLYLLALYATLEQAGDSTRFNRSPYTTALASWVLADIQSMVAEFTT
jgi:hypothetical protein